MIDIKFFRDRKGYISRYSMEGHSEYDDFGRDIVCSAVSILAQTALMSFVSVCNIDEEDLIYTVTTDGFLDVQLPKDLDDKTKKETQIIMKTILVGFDSIIENYPENVRLTYREV